MNRLRLFALTLTFAAAATLSGAPGAAQAGSGSRAMSLVPADAATVGLVRPAELRTSPLSGRFFSEADRMTVSGDGATFLLKAGLDPMRDVDTIVFAAAPEGTSRGRAVLIAEGRFDPAKIGAALVEQGAVRVESPNGIYFRMEADDEGDAAVAIVDRGLAVVGTEASVVAALEANRSGGTMFAARGALAPQFASIDPAASAWVLIDVARASRIHNARVPAQESKGAATIDLALANVSYITIWSADTGSELRFGGSASSSDAETRQLLEDTLRGVLAAWRLSAQGKVPELVPLLRKVKVENDGQKVKVSGALPGEMLRKLSTMALQHEHSSQKVK
jgi:hypothetical protein